ncbi:MAG: hypothetical protein ACR2IE_00560 [Candidatus Sumerlaeaceae bacterium]
MLRQIWHEEATSLVNDINSQRETFEELTGYMTDDVQTANGTLQTAVKSWMTCRSWASSPGLLLSALRGLLAG